MKEKRRYDRSPEPLQMHVKTSAGDNQTYTARDVSDGGIFLFAMNSEQFSIGTEVVISPTKHGAGITPPTIKGRVVRSSAQGIGIEFIEPSFS